MSSLNVLLLLVAATITFPANVAAFASKVIVTGASGRTGKLVFSNLINQPSNFDAVGCVRSESSAKRLMKDVPNCRLDQLAILDVTAMDNTSDPPKLLENADAMIICTSAVPKISKASVIRQMLRIPLNVIRKKPAINFRGFRFRYRPGQHPEMVDYEGQKKQIDLAKKLGVKRVVVVSSMGGTDETNFLNSIGKTKDGRGNGDILIWKRKAEKYLIESGLDYTIIHPGGLQNTPASQEQLMLDVDDKLIKNEKRSISRADVANLCVAAMEVGKEGQSVSFDCIASEVEEGTEIKSATEALEEFLAKELTCDYAL